MSITKCGWKQSWEINNGIVKAIDYFNHQVYFDNNI